MEASSVGSDNTLRGCSPLSWCGIVSLARCDRRLHRRGRNASLQAIRFVSRFIPAELGPSLSIVLCLVSIVCIVCIVPVWVPLHPPDPSVRPLYIGLLEHDAWLGRVEPLGVAVRELVCLVVGHCRSPINHCLDRHLAEVTGKFHDNRA